MIIVCEKCGRVLKDGKWVDDVVPIHRVSMTVCPRCQKETPGKKRPTGVIHQKIYEPS